MPVLLPGKSHGRRSLVGYSPWGCKESDMTEQVHFTSQCDSLIIAMMKEVKQSKHYWEWSRGRQARVLWSRWMSLRRWNLYLLLSLGNPLQYSCLENPMDGGAWWATVHGSRESLKINLTADIENRLVNTVGEGDSGMGWESSVGIYTPPCVK